MRRSHGLAVAAIALTALSACGSSPEQKTTDGSGAKVATLTSAAPPASASAKAQRPRERLDTTPEEFEALLAPFNKCLKEQGIDQKGAKVASDGAKARAATGAEATKLDAAYRVCESQYFPLPPWEKDPANPEARDFAVAVVKCLKGKGIKYVELAEDGISYALGGDQNDSKSIRLGMEYAPDCEREVAAKTK